MTEPEYHAPLVENLHRFRVDRSLCIMAAQLYRVAGQPDRATAQLRLAAALDEPIAALRAALPSRRQR